MASRRDGMTIGQVSALVGVPVPTLRSWHERYGVAPPARTPGGHRRYGPADVQLLHAMRAAVARGLSARAAAQAVRAPSGPPDVLLPLLAELLERAAAHDQDGVGEALDRAEQAVGVDRTLDGLLVPALREIGDRWERDEVDVGVEHLATAAAQRWIARRTAMSTPRRGPAPVLLAAAPDNRHTVALEALGLLLHDRGWPTCQLGADTPVPALLRAVAAVRPQAVVLTAHQVSRRRAAVAALEALTSTGARLWFAGAAFDSARHRAGVPGTWLGRHLPEAADLVTAELRRG